MKKNNASRIRNACIERLQYYYFKRYSKLVFENRHHAVACQNRVFTELIKKAATTSFGQEHRFDSITCYKDFKQRVPIRDYEDFKPYIQRIFDGESSVLGQGKPSFFGKSSGTTDAPKYLPVTDDFIKSTQFAAKYMLCNLILVLNQADFIGHKVFYLTDQQDFELVKGFKCGAISEIKASLMPWWAAYFALPPKGINRIKDPVEKLNAVIDTLSENDIRLMVGLPVWLAHFLKEFEKRRQNAFKMLFPNVKVLFVSGMNYEPYAALLKQHLGDDVLIMENYSATEGNIAYQAVPNTKGMELICNQGLFYEFVPLEEIDKKEPTRLQLKEVQLRQPYVLIVSGNNGLWAYKMNDIVEFVSIEPYRLLVSGRLKDIFSPFGEHILPIQAEQAMAATCQETGNILTDFMIIPDFNAPTYRYKCFIELNNLLPETNAFAAILHKNLCLNNSYYADLVRTQAMTLPEIIPVRKNFFYEFLQQKHKRIVAQQKMVHLVHDATIEVIINALNPYA
jgi:phenylacetate-coenzyme A ligase PaaK-like adenylate-forming protein